jgi:hypothetical protein
VLKSFLLQVVVTKCGRLDFSIDDLKDRTLLESLRHRMNRSEVHQDLESNRDKIKDEIRQYLGTGVDVIVMAETAPKKFFTQPAAVQQQRGGDFGVGVGDVQLIDLSDNDFSIANPTADRGATMPGDRSLTLTDFSQQKTKWCENTLYRMHFGGNRVVDTDGSQARFSPKQYAQYEALSMRYAFNQFGLPLPSAMVTAKGDCIMIVKFPTRTDVKMEEWEVIEMHLQMHHVRDLIEKRLKPAAQRRGTIVPRWGEAKLHREQQQAIMRNLYSRDGQDFEEFQKEVEDMVGNMMDGAATKHGLERLCDGLVVAGGEFCQKPDKTDELLGKVQGQHVPIFSAEEAYDEVSIFESSYFPNGGGGFSAGTPQAKQLSRRLSTANKRAELQNCITSELKVIQDEKEMVQKLLDVLKEHARSLVLKDLFYSKAGVAFLPPSFPSFPSVIDFLPSFFASFLLSFLPSFLPSLTFFLPFFFKCPFFPAPFLSVSSLISFLP